MAYEQRPDHFGPWDHRGLPKRYTLHSRGEIVGPTIYEIWDNRRDKPVPRTARSLDSALRRLDELNAADEDQRNQR